VCRNEFETLDQAREVIGAYIERYHDRPDSRLNYLNLAVSFEPLETERWRAFISLVSRFKTLAERDVAVVRMPDDRVDLRFEIRGKATLAGAVSMNGVPSGI